MDKKNQNNPKMNMPRFNMNWIYGIVIVTLIALYMTGGGAANSSVTTETSYDQFKTMVMKGYASKIVVNKEQNIQNSISGSCEYILCDNGTIHMLLHSIINNDIQHIFRRGQCKPWGDNGSIRHWRHGRNIS